MRSDRPHSVSRPLLVRGAVNVKVLIAGVGAVVGVGVLVWAIAGSSLFAGDPMVDAARMRPAVDAETGRAYRQFRMPIDDAPPWRSPDTGKETVWPAEQCYWTTDGTAKLEPTLVILNEYLGTPGPTLCPDCGREVTRHNPLPPVELMVRAAEGG